jgi:hypothetical protein
MSEIGLISITKAAQNQDKFSKNQARVQKNKKFSKILPAKFIYKK